MIFFPSILQMYNCKILDFLVIMLQLYFGREDFSHFYKFIMWIFDLQND